MEKWKFLPPLGLELLPLSHPARASCYTDCAIYFVSPKFSSENWSLQHFWNVVSIISKFKWNWSLTCRAIKEASQTGDKGLLKHMPVLHSQFFNFWHISDIIFSTGLHRWGSSLMDSPWHLNCLAKYFIWYSPNIANDHSLITFAPFPFFYCGPTPQTQKICTYMWVHWFILQHVTSFRWTELELYMKHPDTCQNRWPSHNAQYISHLHNYKSLKEEKSILIHRSL
jgi:hypothetical protein